MNWDWSVIIKYYPKLLDGAWLTLELVAVSGLIGIALALPLALARTSQYRSVQILPYMFIYFFRGTPLLIQIFLIYYGAAQFEYVRESAAWIILKEPYWCAIIALSLNTAAYTAELFRGAIQAIPPGEIEAAQSLGMNVPTQVRRIIVPRMFGISLPGYGNEVVLMLKSSALASTITLLDITGMARTIQARTYTPVELFTAAGVIYLVIAAGFILLFRFLELTINRYQHYDPQAGK